jgi:outer membrane protein assembly factor BamB
VRRPLIALGVVVLLLAVAAIAYLVGLGPLAPQTASGSVVFVAISRSTDEADAREIEAIDLTAGTRQLFDAGGRITAMALSADRRSLYVGLDGGKIVLLDATTGSQFGAIDLGGPGVVSLAPTADGRTLFAVAVTNISSSVVPIDLAAKKALEPITFTSIMSGPAVVAGDALVVPLGDARGLQLAFIDVNTRAVMSRTTLPRGSLVPPLAFRIGRTQAGIFAFDPGFSGGLPGMRVYVLADHTHWSEVALQAPFPAGLGQGRSVLIGLQAAATADGTIHVCAGAGTSARRYVIGTDLKAVSAGSDCGPLVGGDQILMAKRDPAQLLVLDGHSGKTVRTLPLAGVPARLVH